jgi:hypothetical protein
MTPRFDFVASYWLFTWWVLYYFGVLPFNPKLFLILGTLENALGIFILPKEKLPFYIVINFFIKVLPLILVWNTVTTKRDIAFGVILGLVYLTWLKLNQEDVFRMRTPMMDFLRKYNLS